MNHINQVLNVGLIASALMLTGCANLMSIQQTTYTPALQKKMIKEKKGDGSVVEKPVDVSGKYGKAIHLDAKQRLVLVNSLGQYCAEPSPDALVAYAASLGIGVTDPNKIGGSVGQALQSSAASIGLRTQSITLMRDALYRICEAHLNGSIDEAQATLMLRRSQDLTAVIVAVEQLTGAIAANQVILNQASGANASAIMYSNQNIIENLRDDIKDLQKEITDLESSINDLKVKSGAIQVEIESEKKKGDNADQDLISRKTIEKESKDAEITAKKATLGQKKKALQEREQMLTTLMTHQDSLMANASASNSSSGQFSVINTNNKLDKGASEVIAGSVQSMVLAALKKDYLLDNCIIHFSNKIDGSRSSESYNIMEDICESVIKKAASEFGVSFMNDSDTYLSEKVKSALSKTEGKAFFEKWKKKAGEKISTVLELDFITHPDFKRDRADFLEELSEVNNQAASSEANAKKPQS